MKLSLTSHFICPTPFTVVNGNHFWFSKKMNAWQFDNWLFSMLQKITQHFLISFSLVRSYVTYSISLATTNKYSTEELVFDKFDCGLLSLTRYPNWSSHLPCPLKITFQFLFGWTFCLTNQIKFYFLLSRVFVCWHLPGRIAHKYTLTLPDSCHS